MNLGNFLTGMQIDLHEQRAALRQVMNTQQQAIDAQRHYGLHPHQEQAIDRLRRTKQVPLVMVMETKPLPRIPERGNEPSWANLNGRWL
jgi:hypothetical protein